jgi:hypothetical protein
MKINSAVFKLLDADRRIDRQTDTVKLSEIFATSTANTTNSGFATLSVSNSHIPCAVIY